MSDLELRNKFEGCVLEHIGSEQADQLWQQLTRFEELASTEDLPMLNERPSH